MNARGRAVIQLLIRIMVVKAIFSHYFRCYQINFFNLIGPNLGERCGNRICSNSQQCCRTCDEFGDPSVPSRCSARCPQVFCQPVQPTTKRPNTGGGINSGQTG